MLVLAHRGASTIERENTLAAFTEAVRAGADGVELDVRRTADDQLVVHHDAQLADGRTVVACRRSELPADVPSLAEALSACAPLLVNVEIKDLPGELAHRTDERSTARLVAQQLGGDRPTPILVSSFDPGALEAVRRAAPQLDLGVLAAGVEASHLVERARALGAVAVHPADRDVDAELVDAAHAVGLLVNVWTVDDPDRLAELRVLGVDAVICNDPAGARRALRRP